MRDPILDRNNSYLEALNNAIEVARREANNLPEATEVINGLTRWCQILLNDTQSIDEWEEKQDISRLLHLPSDLLPFQELDKISDVHRKETLQGALEGLLENKEYPESNVMAWFLGKALATVLFECFSHPADIIRCPVNGFRNLASSHEISFFSFEETLTSLLQDHPAAFNGVMFYIEEHVKTILKNPGIGAYSIEKESFNLTVDAWRSNQNIEDLPRTSMNTMLVHYEALSLIPCIISVERSTVLKCLNRFDFPDPIRQVLGAFSILHDRDEIAALLRASPNCSDDGKSWNRSLTSLLILETVEWHCEKLMRAASEAQNNSVNGPAILKKTRETLSSWFLELGKIIMKRHDGRFLGSQWMLLKIADERVDRARRGHIQDRESHEIRQNDLIEWISLGLYKAGLAGHDVEALVEFPEMPNDQKASPEKTIDSGSSPQAPRLAALSASAILDHMINETSRNNPQRLLAQLDALLAFRDPGFKAECILSTNTTGIPENCCGYLYSRTQDPSERWKHSWNLLVEQRRRAQHWRQTQDGDALATSQFLVATGTTAIRWLISFKKRGQDNEEKLWRTVFDAARECWLTVPVAPFTGQVESQIERLFALHPKVFNPSVAGNGLPLKLDDLDSDNGYDERLAKDLANLGGDDTILTACFLNAHHNGASLDTMRKVLMWNDGQIDHILAQFEKWQKVERSVRQIPNLLSQLTEFRTNIA